MTARRVRSTVTETDLEARGVRIAQAKKLEHWPLDRLKPYEHNPRAHSDAQVTEMAGLITAYGFTDPILVDGKAGILAGHLRLAAARELGLKSVPVIELSHLDENHRRAFVIAHNRIALTSTWDDEQLETEMAKLQADGFDMELTAFTDEEVEQILGAETEDPEDEAMTVEQPRRAVSRPGDVWILGAHRLACGRSGKTQLVFCDLTVRRWQKLTGKRARLTRSRKSFAEVQIQRSAKSGRRP